jgi:probable rRNA maturation factor
MMKRRTSISVIAASPARPMCCPSRPEQGITVERHLARLVVHGTLHLLGCDHDTDEKSEQMQSLEVVALKRLDIALGERNDGGGSGADDAAPRDR